VRNQINIINNNNSQQVFSKNPSGIGNMGQLSMMNVPVGMTNSMQNIQSEQYGDNSDMQDINK
jgi:hypothetical protein